LATVLVVAPLACGSSGSTTSVDGGPGGGGHAGGSAGAPGGGGSSSGGHAGGSAGAPGGGSSSGGHAGGSTGTGGAAGGSNGGAPGSGGGAIGGGGAAGSVSVGTNGGSGANGGRGGAAGGTTGAAGGHGGATAALVTYAFTAHVAHATKDPDVPPGGPAVGDPVTGTFVYDADPSHYAAGATQFAQTAPGSGLFIQAGAWSFSPRATTMTNLLTAAGGSGASFFVFAPFENWDQKDVPALYASFMLEDPSATMSLGLSLPATVDVTKLKQDAGGGLIFKTDGSPHFEIDAIIDTFVRQN
jgi:hypothetical protein